MTSEDLLAIERACQQGAVLSNAQALALCCELRDANAVAEAYAIAVDVDRKLLVERGNRLSLIEAACALSDEEARELAGSATTRGSAYVLGRVVQRIREAVEST